MKALGTMYYYGDGVPQSYADAAAWFRKAADAGNADAMFNLGLMYALRRMRSPELCERDGMVSQGSGCGRC